MSDIVKYPRTIHIRGSRKSGDDFELEDVPFEILADQFVVYEFKIDGSNCAVSFEGDAENMILQSRGHQLRGGQREKEFVKFKMWAERFRADLFDILGERYIMYGENVFAKHTVYYDKLPHYFLEFDIFDKEKEVFLSTAARKRLTEGLSLVSVPIAYEGKPTTLEHLKSFIGFSVYKSSQWKQNLLEDARKIGLNEELVLQQTDDSNWEEGIYIKVETEEETVGRYKFVRDSFTNAILNQGSHWHDRPIIPNRLADGVDIMT
jgi:hypothetical protein